VKGPSFAPQHLDSGPRRPPAKAGVTKRDDPSQPLALLRDPKKGEIRPGMTERNVRCRAAMAREGSGSCPIPSSNRYSRSFHTHTIIQAACCVSPSNSCSVLITRSSHNQTVNVWNICPAAVRTGECLREGSLLAGSSYSVELTGLTVSDVLHR
jgi:hypothetical protein